MHNPMNRSLPAEIIAELDIIAPYLASCRYDPNASLRYSLLADALYWTDEVPAANLPCDTAFRYLLFFRTLLIIERPSNEVLHELWEAAKSRFAEWPGFSGARVTPSLDLQHFYLEVSERAEKELFDDDQLE